MIAPRDVTGDPTTTPIPGEHRSAAMSGAGHVRSRTAAGNGRPGMLS